MNRYMKTPYRLLTLLALLLHGCTGSGTIVTDSDEKSDKCELTAFSIDGDSNGLASSIEFEIDHTSRTVKGHHTSRTMAAPPVPMIPTFTIDGHKAQVDGALVSSGLARMDFTGEILFVVVAENGDSRTYRVGLEWTYDPEQPEPPKSDKCDLLSFSIGAEQNPGLREDIVFSIDGQALTVTAQYLHWIEGAEPGKMIPTFTTNGDRVLVEGGETISRRTGLSFGKDFSLAVLAEDGTSRRYTVSLVCPQINEELPVLHFSEIQASQITSKKTYVKSRLEMYSPFTAEGWWAEGDPQVEIRGRGNSTWELPKKPYRIKFPSKHSPIGLNHAKAKSWTLLAQHMDKSLMRNHMAYKVGAIMFNAAEGYHESKAIMFSPATRHVNVYFKGEYHGIYQMSDHVERDAGRVAVEKLTAADGTTKTGGYIIESNIQPDDSPWFWGNRTNISFLMKYPEDDDYAQSQLEWIDGFVGDAEAVLYGVNFKDKTNGWRKYFDEKTMADFIIIKEFVGDPDGYMSTRCYKRDGVEKLFFGPVWDCDKSWDNDPRIATDAGLMMDAGFHMAYVNPDWFNRVWQDADFRRFVYNRWLQKKGELYDMVMHELDTQPAAMAKSIRANFTVWDYFSQGSEGKPPAATYELEIERLRTQTDNRCNILDREFNK